MNPCAKLGQRIGGCAVVKHTQEGQTVKLLSAGIALTALIALAVGALLRSLAIASIGALALVIGSLLVALHDLRGDAQ